MNGLIYILAIGGVLWAIIERLYQHHHSLVESQKDLVRLKQEDKDSSVALLSNKCSKHIIKVIEDYQKTTSEGLTTFMKDATELLEKLKKKTQKTV